MPDDASRTTEPRYYHWKNERYRYEKILGKGGFALVCLATDLRLDRLVAIKKLQIPERRENLTREQMVSRFYAEARILAKLKHPNIVTLYDYFDDDYYMVMEYLEGLDLGKEIKAHPDGMAPDRALAFFCQILDGLALIHAGGMLHRDIKPANLLLTADRQTAKISDFGLTKIPDGSVSMASFVSIGYAPREQMSMMDEPGPYTDLFPLGVILFQLLTGRHPFHPARGGHDFTHAEWAQAMRRQPTKVEALRPELARFQPILDSMLEHDCTRRHQSVAAVREELDQSGNKPSGMIKRVNPKDGLTYVWIPPGTFRMGCSVDDDECYAAERPPHDVKISKGFWLCQTPVTQAAWKRVMNSNPSHFKGDDHPVERVTWQNAADYAKAIGGRLPTEAEWEYAARAGNPNRYYGDLDAIAWYGGNSGSTTHPVGQKDANNFELHDMLGNVWEWVADWFDDEYYKRSEKADPKGPAPGTQRVLRGGSWLNNTTFLRVSNRLNNAPAFSYNGFRCTWDHPSP